MSEQKERHIRPDEAGHGTCRNADLQACRSRKGGAPYCKAHRQRGALVVLLLDTQQHEDDDDHKQGGNSVIESLHGSMMNYAMRRGNTPGLNNTSRNRNPAASFVVCWVQQH